MLGCWGCGGCHRLTLGRPIFSCVDEAPPGPDKMMVFMVEGRIRV